MMLSSIIKDVDELRSRFLAAWVELDQRVIDTQSSRASSFVCYSKRRTLWN